MMVKSFQWEDHLIRWDNEIEMAGVSGIRAGHVHRRDVLEVRVNTLLEEVVTGTQREGLKGGPWRILKARKAG